MKNLPALNELLTYKNPLTIQRFTMNFPEYAQQAEGLFIEMLKYLWLSRKFEQEQAANPACPTLQFNFVMHEEMRLMDNMWHEFILITKEYHAFCLQYFGEYLHHEPNMREKITISEEEFAHELQLFLGYVYDNLGEETLIAWFHEHLEEAVV